MKTSRKFATPPNILVVLAVLVSDVLFMPRTFASHASHVCILYTLPLRGFLCSPHAHYIAALDKYREITLITIKSTCHSYIKKKKPFELYNFPTISGKVCCANLHQLQSVGAVPMDPLMSARPLSCSAQTV